jgi:hypothetical protein
MEYMTAKEAREKARSLDGKMTKLLKAIDRAASKGEVGVDFPVEVLDMGTPESQKLSALGYELTNIPDRKATWVWWGN